MLELNGVWTLQKNSQNRAVRNALLHDYAAGNPNHFLEDDGSG